VAAVVAAVVVLVFTALLAYEFGTADAPVPQARPSATPSASKTPTPAQIYDTVAPSVVSIVAAGPAGEAGGTGVIINADGTIMTARHVINGATQITVIFADGTKSAATVASDDAATDIASLTPATLPSVVVPAVIGSAGRLNIGDNVVAIGDQLGLVRTTTTGVVSGLDRGAPGPDGITLSGLIQFDAAVNHGSSGGPLIDSRGQIVGIVVALANPTTAGTFIGIGFAVPIGSAVAGGNRAPQQ
jgi:S1-C subfamily serine protease